MFKTLKTLISMQIANKKILRKVNSKSKYAVHFLLRLLLILFITLIATFVFYVFKNIIHLKADRNFLLFVVGVTQIITIIANINLFKNALYFSKDNEILFSFPASHSEIFISRLIVFYINEFIKNLYFLVPIILGFGFFEGIDLFYILNLVLLSVILPLFPVLIGALLSLPVMFIKKILNAYPILNTVISLVFIAAIFIFAINLLYKLPVPLRILALFTSFIDGLTAFVVKFNQFLPVFSNIVNFLFAGRTAWDYILVFAVIGILSLLVYVLAMPLYFKIVSHFKDVAVTKKHNSEKIKQKTTYMAFLSKEFKLLFRTPGKLFSYLAFVVAFPFLIYIINYIFGAINTNRLGDILVVAFNLIIGLVLLTANNTISAVSLSSEGLEFALLKASPAKIYNIAFAKITVNLLFSMLAIISGFVAVALINNMNTVNLVLVFLVFILVNSGHILWSFQFDVLNPKYQEIAQKGNSDNNENIGKSIFSGLITAIILPGIALFFLLENMSAGWIKIILISAAFLVVRFVLFYYNLKVYFNRIEL